MYAVDIPRASSGWTNPTLGIRSSIRGSDDDPRTTAIVSFTPVHQSRVARLVLDVQRLRCGRLHSCR